MPLGAPPGPGDTRIPLGLIASISSTDASSFLSTIWSHPKSPKYCADHLESGPKVDEVSFSGLAGLSGCAHLTKVVSEAVVVVDHYNLAMGIVVCCCSCCSAAQGLASPPPLLSGLTEIEAPYTTCNEGGR